MFKETFKLREVSPCQIVRNKEMFNYGKSNYGESNVYYITLSTLDSAGRP